MDDDDLRDSPLSGDSDEESAAPASKYPSPSASGKIGPKQPPTTAASTPTSSGHPTSGAASESTATQSSRDAGDSESASGGLSLKTATPEELVSPYSPLPLPR